MEIEKSRMFWIVGLLIASVALAWAGRYSGTRQSGHLYASPDPSAGGGIAGRIESPQKTIFRICAVNAHDPDKVYKGRILGEGNEFRFAGLPVGKYDLVVVYEDRFYEGLTLNSGENTLSGQDREQIAESIMASVPFFDKKKIHRCSGRTGKRGKARCVLQEVREGLTLMQSAENLGGGKIQPRSFKLTMLEDVGIGWQLMDTREIVRMEAGPDDRKGIVPHAYVEKLAGIRVLDDIKDMGMLDLRE